MSDQLYNAKADGEGSYLAAIEAKREKALAAIKREVVIGDCRLLLGDCLEILPAIGRVHAVITDPPFGISDSPIKGQGRTGKRTGSVNHWHPESGWDKSLDPRWAAVCDIADTIAWFGQWRKRGEVEAFMPIPLRAEIVWAKDCHVGPPSPVAPRDERIWVFSKAGLKPATFETSVWDCPIIPTWAFKHHKNEKPVPLMERLVRWVGADIVADPFMGSGTTGVACIKTGRKFIGIELSDEHFETAVERITDAHNRPDMFIEASRSPEPVQEGLPW